MQEKNSQNANIILERLKALLGLGTDYALADVLRTKANTLSTWKKRNTLDYPAIIALCESRGISLDELFANGDEKGNLKGNPSGNLISKTQKKYEGTPEVSYFTEPHAPMVVTVNQNNEDVISLVATKAAAGYLNGYADPEFIETLPTIALPGLKGGIHRAFEVKGASMLPTHHPGSISIGRYVESFDDIRDRRVYIVVTRDEGVVLKRVLNRVREEGKLILISDNENKREYPNYPVNASDIMEMWYWRGSIIRESPEPGNMYNRLNDMQAELALMRAEVNQIKGKDMLRLKGK